MDGEQNGTQMQQNAQQQEQGQQQAAQQPQQQAQGAPGIGKLAGDDGEAAGGAAKPDASAYLAQLAERDKRIAELEAQVADAAKNAEAAEALRGEIAGLKAQGESDRIDFKLQLVGCRNVKAARPSWTTTKATSTHSRQLNHGCSPTNRPSRPARPGYPTRAQPRTPTGS